MYKPEAPDGFIAIKLLKQLYSVTGKRYYTEYVFLDKNDLHDAIKEILADHHEECTDELPN